MCQARAGCADPYRGNAAHRRLATAHGATLLDRTPVTAIREVGRRATRSMPAARRHGAGRVDPRRRRLDQRAAGRVRPALPLTVTKEQVTYFAAADPAAFAPDRFPVWIWMDEPIASTASRPTARPGPRPPRTPAGSRRPGRPATSSRDDAMPSSASERVHRRRTCRTPPGPAHLHEDLPLHADPGPGLRGRSRCRTHPASSSALGAGHGFKFASRPRAASSSSSRSTAHRRRTARSGAFRIDRPILLERTRRRARLTSSNERDAPAVTRPFLAISQVDPVPRYRGYWAAASGRCGERGGDCARPTWRAGRRCTRRNRCSRPYAPVVGRSCAHRPA